MSDLAPRPGGMPSRRSREQRAYRLVVTGGTAGVITVVGLALAIFGVLPPEIPVLAAIVAAVCFFMLRRMTAPRR